MEDITTNYPHITALIKSGEFYDWAWGRIVIAIGAGRGKDELIAILVTLMAERSEYALNSEKKKK